MSFRIQTPFRLEFPVLFSLAFFLIASAARADIPLDSLHGPMCGMIDPDTKQQVAISPSFTRVNVVITDAVAQAVVTQRFVNPFRAKSETVYLFPLPDAGAIHGMKYQYHDSLYVAQIMDKDKAQAKYDSIKQSGGQAALLLQEKPNIFMQRIASIGPGETAFVEIRLTMPLKYLDGELELAFPTRIGPRYQPAGVAPKKSAAAATSPWNPPEDRSGPEFEFNVLIQSGVDLSSIYSPTHPIQVGDLAAMRKALEDRQVITAGDAPSLAFARGMLLQTATTYPNRDFVLRMKRAAAAASDFSVALSKDDKGQGYFMLNLYPDTAAFSGKRGPLEVIVLVDVSGSQMGWPLDREKEISLNILSHLTPADNVDVLSFSDNVAYAFGNETPVPATSQNVATAENFIRGLSIQGGTELRAAVQKVLAVPSDGSKKRIFVFLTDGFITDEESIVADIAANPSKPTIFTFGAGDNLNRSFLEECAKVGNGFATPLLSTDATGPLVEAAWQRIESPALTDITVDFGGLGASDVLAPVSNTLYRGMPYTVTGKFAESGLHTVTLTAQRQGTAVTMTRSIDFGAESALSWGIPKLWARRKIEQLTLAQGNTESNKSAIIQVSQDFQVLSQYTAFLASQAQAVTPGNTIGIGPATGLAEARGTMLYYDLTVRGSMLFLDWKAPVDVQSIRIYDLHGRMLFEYKPAAGAPAIGRWVWDGRDSLGRTLGKGRYVIAVQTRSGMRSQAFDWTPGR